MDKRIRKLKKNRLKAIVLILMLMVGVFGLSNILFKNENIKIGKIVTKVNSLNASIVDAGSEVSASSYDEVTYSFDINKDSDDEAIITGTLTDSESKYARFKEVSGSTISENGKKIILRTTSKTPKIILIITNAPYGEIINPSFKINSESNQNITTDPITITTSSIEGVVKDEKGTLIGEVELSLIKNNEEIKRTYSSEEGKYVFSLPEEGNYIVRLEEEKYKIVRQEEKTINENKRILDIVVKETNPFNLEIDKTIYKVDLVLDGKKESYDYNNLKKVIRTIKKANTISGSIYYNISIKNTGDEKGTLTIIKDILHDGLSFNESKNPGWIQKENDLYYTVLEGTDLESQETKEAKLILDIKETKEAKNYINEAVAKSEAFKNVVYILNNNVYKEEYVIEGEKIENITPNVENFSGWYTDRNYTNKYNFEKEVDKNIILYGKVENTKYNVTFIDKNPLTSEEIILETKVLNEGETIEYPAEPSHNGYTFKCWTVNDICIENENVYNDLIIYTKYDVNEYNIRYELDGGILSEANPSSYTIETESFTLNNPSKEGYTFLGWTGEEITEPSTEVTIEKGSTGDKEFTAHFEIKKSTLTIDPNEGTYLDNSSSVTYTEDYGTIKTIEDSVKRGYTFKKYIKTGGGIFTGNVFTFDEEDALLIAQYQINTYSITYNNITEEEREALSNPATYNVETDTFTLNNPSTRKDIFGYNSEDFLGWDDGTGTVSIEVTIEKGSIGDKEFTAVWKENEDDYNIIYNYNGGSLEEGKTNPSTYKRGTESFTLNNPSKEGYNFTGWSGTGLTGNNREVTIPKGSSGNKSFVANYEVIPYTITYEGLTNDEKESLNNPTSYNIETDTFTINNPSARKDQDGYDEKDFLGWDDGSGTVSINVTIEKGSTGNKTYTAIWKDNEDDYGITYNYNGGSLEEGKTNPSTYKRKTNTFTLNNPSKEGYTFTGWSGTGIDGTSTEVTIEKGSTGDRSYEAHFTPITYTISYEGLTNEEKESLNNPTSYNIETDTFTLRNPSTRKDSQGYNKEDFIGWDDGSGNPSIVITIEKGTTGNKTYTAIWTVNEDIYGIIYDYNNGTLNGGDTNPSTYTRLTPTFTISNPSKTGYNFTGWSGTGLTGNNNTEVTISKGSSGDRSYEAHYTPITYTISYEGLTNEEKESLNNPISYTIESNNITLTNPSRTGYTFIGWSGTDIEGKSMSVTIPTGSTGDKEYTANFEAITYNISYTLNGGSANNPRTYNVETENFTLNNPSKEGYTFTGWSGTGLTGNDNIEVTISKGSTGDRSYEAHYTPIVYNITYDYDGGSLEEGKTNPSTYTIESETITFENSSKTGYTFKHYKDGETIVSEIPTGSTGDKHLVANYDINRFNVNFYNEEELFGTEIVDYNTKATIVSETPTKSHNIFLYWSEDKVTEYNFDTLITENKNLYAVYEEVEAPTITLDPILNNETNKTWVCDDNGNSDCGVTVTITPKHDDYETYYKVGDGEYTLYSAPFKVYDNTEISAFSKKSNINSSLTSKEVNNIDKINPIIKENSFSTKVAAFSINLTGKIVDNESGINKYELFIVESGETLDESNPYTTIDGFSGNNDEVDINFKFTGLEALTTYDMYIKAYDYVGNEEIFKITAATSDYIARIIGRSNLLYENETEWEKYESVQDAIDDCANLQCTIQINPSIVNESVEVKEDQDVTLDLDGKKLTSTSDYTVKVDNNAKFTLVDHNETDPNGSIENTYAKAIINNGTFTLGEGYTEKNDIVIVPEKYPVVNGETVGLENYGTFYYFDGTVTSINATGNNAYAEKDGGESITQYPYNINIIPDSSINRIITKLDYVEDPEARIKSVYYTKLNTTTGLNAVDSSNNGTYENKNVNLLSQIKQAGDYGFIYNEVEDSIINGNNVIGTSTALSYVKVDLKNYDETQYLLLNTSCDTLNSYNYGYIAVSETIDDTSNKVINITGNDINKYRIIKLEPNKIYYIYFGFVKSTSFIDSDQYFKINSAELINNTSLSDFEIFSNSVNNYYFVKQEDGTYKNNNIKVGGSIAESAVAFDLTNIDEDLKLIIDYSAYVYNSDIAYININDNLDVISSSNTEGRVLTLSNTSVTNNALVISLPANQKSFVHFDYYRSGNGNVTANYFQINDIRLQKVSNNEEISSSNINYNIIDESNPEITTNDTYYFDHITHNPFIWKDSTGNGFDANVYGPRLSENHTYYSFIGDNVNYATFDSTNLELTDYEESVYLEYSTTNTDNSILYQGSTKEKLGFGKNNNEFIVSNANRVRTYILPSNYSDGEKHSVLVSYKDGDYKFYFDGELQTIANNANSWGGATSESYIGVKSGGGYSFTGNIYQVKVFDKEIDVEDINNTENLKVYLNPINTETGNYYLSNNYGAHSTIAHSYIKYDLTNSSTNKYLNINYSLESESNDYANILVNDNPNVPSTTDTNVRYLRTSGTINNQDLIIPLINGKINYVHFYYVKNSNRNSGHDAFMINSVKMYEDYDSVELSNGKSISSSNKSESILNLPIAKLNEKPSTVVMLKDINMNSPIKIPEEKEMILDLNGYTLSSSASDYLINNYGNLTITDGKYKDDILSLEEAYEDELIINQELKDQYEADLAEYEEYVGLCDGCEPSEEYKLDHLDDYLSYFGIDLDSNYTGFDYTGETKEYTPSFSGIYKVETWGASGATSGGSGGYGGYSSGLVNLSTTDKLYVTVGGEGVVTIGGYNGGGNGSVTCNTGSNYKSGGGGGGATSIAINNNLGELKNYVDNKDDILIVAGAGGGGSFITANYSGGNGGGYIGNTGTGRSITLDGGTQESGYSFGLGQDGGPCGGSWGESGRGGAGGGFYGGFASQVSAQGIAGGAGGSGYIGSDLLTNGVMYCYNCSTSDETSTKTITTTNVSDDATSNYAKSGNGYAKISPIISNERLAELRNNLPKTYNVKKKPEVNYKVYNSGKELMVISEDYFGTDVAGSTSNKAEIKTDSIHLENNESNKYNEIYYKKTVTKTSVSGKYRVWNRGSGYGNLYIGFATSKDNTINDFVSYKTFSVETDTGEVDFNVKYDGDEEVYFKIILNKTGRYYLFADFTDLYFDTYDKVSNYSSLNGNLNSASNDIILNNTGATLDIDSATINLNKNNSTAIVNRGNLTLGEMSTINVNSANSNGIYNETTGNIETSKGKINVIGANSVGLLNNSKDNIIDGLTIETSVDTDTGIYNRGVSDVIFNNINIYGTGRGFYNYNDKTLTINNSKLASKSNDAFLVSADSSQNKIFINSSNIYSLVKMSSTARDLTINNSNLYGDRGNISITMGSVTINRSYLYNSGTNITNSGILYINDSTIEGYSTLLNNNQSSADLYSFNAHAFINNTNFNLRASNNWVTAISNSGTMELNDSNINTTGTVNQTAISNTSIGYLNIYGNSNISESFSTAINNDGFTRIGTIDKSKIVYNFDFTGSVQEFTVPKTGNYKIEAWGAQGGYYDYAGRGYNFNALGGLGAYTSGDINLTEGEKLYIYVGNEGVMNHDYNSILSPIYNGGNIYGGGATDISISGEENVYSYDNGIRSSLRSESSYLDRIMVAGGGSTNVTGDYSESAGQALSNPDGSVSQITGHAFGYGLNLSGTNSDYNALRGNGGAGYFGGEIHQGGTSYISGYLGSVAMNGSSENPKCTMEEAATNISCSYHTSGKIFTNTVMKAGYEEMPTYSGNGTMKGNFGNGFVKITYLDDLNTNTVLSNPTISAKDYAIYGSGRVELYDGTLKANKAIYSDIDKVTDNYDIDISKNDNKETLTLKEISAEPNVARIGSTNYTSLGLAIEAANDNDEIVILTDINEANSFDIDKNITINYNGHIINSYNSGYLFKNNANLKLYDSTCNNDKCINKNTIYGDGLVLNNNSLTIENIYIDSTLISNTLVYNNSNLNISSITITNVSNGNLKQQFLFNKENATANISNSSLNYKNSNIIRDIFIDNYGTLNIDNSTISYHIYNYGVNSDQTSDTVIYNRSTGTLVFDTVSIDGIRAHNGGAFATNLIRNKNTATIKNSTNINNLFDIYNEGGTLTLENNTFTVGTINNNSGYSSLIILKSGTYASSFNINGTGKSIDNTDNLYSFIMEGGSISTTLNISSPNISWIKSGSLVTTNNYSINNSGEGKIILGVHDGSVETKENTKPIITSANTGIYTSNANLLIDMYDGIITSITPTNAIIDNIETDYNIHREYLEDNKISIYLLHEAMFKNKTQSTENNEVLYYSTDELNNALNNGLINNNDVIQVVSEITILNSSSKIIIPSGLKITFDLNNHYIGQNNETLFENNGELVLTNNQYDTDYSSWDNKVNETLTKLNNHEISYVVYDFSYSGDEEEFTIPSSGTYVIEAWGAQGGNNSTTGKGAYAYGIIDVVQNNKLYINVGGMGSSTAASVSQYTPGGYNGGGYTDGQNCCGRTFGSGGGASDIRLISKSVDESSSLASRIMVAAGGGGGFNGTGGGAGGALTGQNGQTNNGYGPGVGANQTSGGINPKKSAANGSFGQGGNHSENPSTGGGGGYYGGSASYHIDAAGGGSSYISGYQGAVAITGENDLSPKSGCETGTDDVTCSYHYSGKIFDSAVMKSGLEEMPKCDNNSTMTGNAGNGYVKIVGINVDVPNDYTYTRQDAISYLNLLGEFEPEFTDYSGKIENNSNKIVVNNGTLTIDSGEYVGNSYSKESSIIENNGTLTINNGKFIKYIDNISYLQHAAGSILVNNGTVNINDGEFYANSSFVEGWRNVFDYNGNNYSTDFLFSSTIFTNNIEGILNVTGGLFDGISGSSLAFTNDFKNNDKPTKGILIENYGTATISDIISSNTNIGINDGTLTFNNIIMNNINSLNTTNHPNLLNSGSLFINDSNFTILTMFAYNNGNIDINNSNISRPGNGYCYKDSSDDLAWSGYKNSFIFRNYSNDENDNVINITDSTIINQTSTGELIENNSRLNISNSILTSNSNTINNTKPSFSRGNVPDSHNNSFVTILENSEITSNNGVAIIVSSTGTLNLGIEALTDNEVSKTYPFITGNTYGINNAGKFYFYDGYIKGKTKAVYGPITDKETNYTVITPTEKVEDYYVSYLDKVKVIKNLATDEEYYTINDAVIDASSGNILQMINNYNALNTENAVTIDKKLTLDLNGYTINQGNSILFRNENNFTIVDTNTSGNNQGIISNLNGTTMLDNYGDFIHLSGTLSTIDNRLVIRNNALTTEEINNGYSEHTVTIKENGKITASDGSTLINNSGITNIYNGAYLENNNPNSNTYLFINNGVLNIIDLNKDDDNSSESTYPAPWIYSKGNYYDGWLDHYILWGAILNNSSGTVNITGGLFNNGGTYEEGSIEPDLVRIFNNEGGTINIKHLDNYSGSVGRNAGTLIIEDSNLYNLVHNGINSHAGNITIKDTLIEATDLVGNTVGINANNATFDNVTIRAKDNSAIDGNLLNFKGTSTIKNSNINFNGNVQISNNNTLRVENVTINNGGIFNNYGTLNLVNSSITSNNSNTFSNSGTLNIFESSNVISNNGVGIYNNSNGTINLGTQDAVVNTTTPLIEGTTYGIDNSNNGILNMYDGILKGSSGPTALKGSITFTEGGYVPQYFINTNTDDNKYHLTLKADTSSVVIIAKVGKLNFGSQNDPYVTDIDALKMAINYVATNGGNIDLLQSITINEDISSSTPVTIYKNGNTVTLGSNANTTNITFTDGQAPLSSIAKFAANIFGIGDESNNIVIYEMNDGTKLDTSLTYKLYKDDKLISLEEIESGIYSYKGSNNELKPIKGKIYINNLISGDYKLLSSNNKELNFSIDDEGNITGNIKKYNPKILSTDNKVATSLAELIINIQTGIKRLNYLLLIIPIIIILILLLLIRRRNKRLS